MNKEIFLTFLSLLTDIISSMYESFYLEFDIYFIWYFKQIRYHKIFHIQSRVLSDYILLVTQWSVYIFQW